MSWKKKSLPILLGGGVGLVAALGMMFGVLGTWNEQLTDRLFLSQKADPRIVIVAIDDASIGQLGRWPWDRKVHADLIQKISAGHPRAIGYDVNFSEASDHANDEALGLAIESAGNVVLPVLLQLQWEGAGLLSQSVRYDPRQVVSPLALFRQMAASVGFANTPPDRDGVVRRIPMLASSNPIKFDTTIPVFASEVLRQARLLSSSLRIPLDRFGQLRVHFVGSPSTSFKTISAKDVVDGTIPSSAFQDKIVLVGATAPDLHDALFAPTSQGVLMYGVEIHASIINTLLTQAWIVEVPIWIQIFWLILYGALIGFAVARLHARWGASLVFGLCIVYLIGAFVAFDRGYILNLVWTPLVMLFGYTLVTIERRIHSELERRKLRSALNRYVSPSVVDEVMRDPSKLKLGGVRKHMTILFSDLRGFTTLSEGLDPQELVSLLNTYLTRMTGIVFEHKGVLDKYIGDAVMAFWGAPIEDAKQAEHAVETALHMKSALEEMNRDKAFGDRELHLGIGVNTGDVVVGNVGGAERFDYTVIGDHVNLASRLEGLTKEYGIQIILTDATAKELSPQIITRKLDWVAVKGKKEPALIYEAIGQAKDVSAMTRQTIERYEEAFDLYCKQKFEQAKIVIDGVVKLDPSDKPSSVLQERITYFIEHPPEKGWKGTWVYTKK